MVRKDLRAVEVASIGYALERLGFQNSIRLRGHIGKFCLI